MTLTDEIRAFNRFYTREIGLLERHMPASELSLPEARVLYEVAAAEGEATAAEIGRTLRMDKAHLSRILARLRARGLVAGRASDGNARRVEISLTPEGRQAFAAVNEGSQKQIDALLAGVASDGRLSLGRAMTDMRAALGDPSRLRDDLRLRGLEPGDLGWIIHRQALLYAKEYSWDWTFEALAARIVAGFVDGFNPSREEGWAADWGGAIVGSVFLMKGETPHAGKLRLLYVEPSARGRGLGAQLVDRCIGRAREVGYSTLTLWTNDVLASARRIYQAAGFELKSEAPHHAFGHDLIGQTWELDLTKAP